MKTCFVARRILLLMLVAVLLVGCLPSAPPMSDTPVQVVTGEPLPRTPTSTPAKGATLAPSATPTGQAAAPVSGQRELTLIYTNDEHGHLLPTANADSWVGGATLTTALWRQARLTPTLSGANVLLLSGGDNWVGPAISSWYHGESTVEVMNAMGYRASAVGNHDLDDGPQVLRERAQQAQFPYLAANLYDAGTEELPDFVRPYSMVEINGLKIGIIGLASRDTPRLTAAKQLVGLAFGDYEPALRRWVPEVRRQGAQIVIVVSHICPQELGSLAERLSDLQVSFWGGGHCHQAQVTTGKDSVVAAGSAYWKDYVLVRLTYDAQAGRVVSQTAALTDVRWAKAGANKPQPDATVQRIVTKWDERAQLTLGEVIGYTATGLSSEATAMHNLLVDSWLWAYPQADLALSNKGGFRQGLDRGEITISDVVGVLPFDNELVEIEVRGRDVLDALERMGTQMVWGGMTRDAQGRVTLLRDGSPFDPQATYRLLLIDYLYDNPKYPFRRYDAEPYATSILWRQPVIDWIRAQRSSKDKPLEKMIDQKPRD